MSWSNYLHDLHVVCLSFLIWETDLIILYHRASPVGSSVVKNFACQCRRHKRSKFNPWVGKIPWRRACHPTPVFFHEKSHGPRSLVDCGPWICKQSDMTEATEHAILYYKSFFFFFFVIRWCKGNILNWNN